MATIMEHTPEQASSDRVSSRHIEPHEPVLCPCCFYDLGLRFEAEVRASEPIGTCPNCGTLNTKTLTRQTLLEMSRTFFVRGSTHKGMFGAAPVLQINDTNTSGAELVGLIARDVELLETVLGIRVFRYGPRLWMLGRIDPLEALENEVTRDAMIQRIIREYPSVSIDPATRFYRIRKAPTNPDLDADYDAPPIGVGGAGRLDTISKPVLYGSQDLEICVHECRYTAEDDLYVGILSPTRTL